MKNIKMSTNNKIRFLNLAELGRQLERAQNEVRMLEGLSQWDGASTHRFALAHYRKLAAKLTKSIDELK
jgi:hypothetical protein